MRKRKKVGKSIKRVFSKVMVLMLSLLFILQMFLPIVIHATEAMDDNNENEVETVEQSETEVEAEFIEEPVEEESIEQEPLEEEPVQEAEEEIEEEKVEEVVEQQTEPQEEAESEETPEVEKDESVDEEPTVEENETDVSEDTAEATTLTFEEENIRIEVAGEAGVIPEGTQIKLNPIAEAEMDLYLDAIREQRDNQMSYASLFDINLVDADGNKIQPNGEVTVSFYGLDHIQEDDEVFIYHVEKKEAARTISTMSVSNEEVGIEEFDSTVESDNVSFSTDHFSIYVVGTDIIHESSNNRYQMYVGDSIEIEERDLSNGGTWTVNQGGNNARVTNNSGNKQTVSALRAGNATVSYTVQTGTNRWGPTYTTNNFYIDILEKPDSTNYPVGPYPSQPAVKAGKVNTSKNAVPVEGTVNTWDVTVRIEAEDVEQTADIVLVIDSSGSMASGDRMGAAKNAANNFITTLLNENNTSNRIGIVDFSSDVNGSRSLRGANQIGTLTQFVGNLSAEGGTHTQAGIHKAQELLDTVENKADRQYIIVLSDGQPTFSYGMYNPDNYLSEQFVNRVNILNRGASSYVVNDYRQVTTALAPQAAYNYRNTVGGGSQLFYKYNRTSTTNSNTDKYYNNGNSAIAEAHYSKLASSLIYTISFEADSVGKEVLKNMATEGNFYEATTNNIQTVLNDIAGNISSTIQDGYLTDVMGAGFEIPADHVGEIVVSQGTADYDETAKTLKWDLGPSLEKTVEGKPNYRYAEITYRVEITDDMIALNEASGDMHKLFPTNESIKFEYEDPNGDKVVINDTTEGQGLDSPEVDPVLYTIKKILIDEHGREIELDQEFRVQITNESKTYDRTKLLTSENSRFTLTTLRDEGTYTVDELLSDEEKDKFIVTYTIDGVEYDADSTDLPQFVVNHDENGIPREDVEIIVTNQKIPQTIDFDFTKVDENGAPLEGAEFTLVNEDGTNYPPNVGSGANFEFKDLKEGTYTLTETKAPDGYRLPTSSWTIKVIRNADGLLEVKFEDGSFMVGELEIPNEKSEFPKTGGIGGFGYLSIGSLLIMLSIHLFIKKDKEWGFENE